MDAERAGRAELILDTAAELLLRHGYRRVTVEDIASAAGIGKGTVYLHWKTREALFVAVLLREYLGAMEELIGQLRADPHTVLLHRLTRAQFLAVQRRPLLRAFYAAEQDVLGKLLGALQAALAPRHHTAFADYLDLLARHGLLRADRDLASVAYVFDVLLDAFFRPDTPTTPGPDVTVKADLLADTVHRALESDHTPDEHTLADIAERALRLFTESAEADRAVLRRAY